MRALTLAMRKTNRMVLGFCAAIGSSIVAVGSLSGGAATIGSEPFTR